MIELIDVTRTYHMGEAVYHALKGINIKIGSGELVAIVGPSGSGKSTTMNILGLLDKPTSGEYRLDGQPTAHLMANDLALLRNRKIGFIFQSFFLLPKLTAWQNVGLPLQYANVPKKEIRRRALEGLAQVGMAQHAKHRPSELSGGQQQRVAIARALVTAPQIILADEPTGALDSTTSEAVLNLLINQAQGTTVVIITHDPNVANECDRVIQVRDGRVISDG